MQLLEEKNLFSFVQNNPFLDKGYKGIVASHLAKHKYLEDLEVGLEEFIIVVGRLTFLTWSNKSFWISLRDQMIVQYEILPVEHPKLTNSLAQHAQRIKEQVSYLPVGFFKWIDGAPIQQRSDNKLLLSRYTEIGADLLKRNLPMAELMRLKPYLFWYMSQSKPYLQIRDNVYLI